MDNDTPPASPPFKPSPRRFGQHLSPQAQHGRTALQQARFEGQCERYHAKRKFSAWWEGVTLAEAAKRFKSRLAKLDLAINRREFADSRRGAVTFFSDISA